jgi:DNA-binding beta-propeller fold protein YncE
VTRKADEATAQPAEIVREYGPFPDTNNVAGVTFDGKDVWFAAGEHLQSFEPTSGKPGRKLLVVGDAGTAFDGRHLYQLADGQIQKVDPETGAVISTIPAPPGGGDAGLTWAEGTLWVAKHRERKIHQVDPKTGKVLRTIDSTRFVTGVTFVDGELWHGTWEDNQSELRRVDRESGQVVERVVMPEGTIVSGLESNGADLFYCGGGSSGKVRVVRRPKRP